MHDNDVIGVKKPCARASFWSTRVNASTANIEVRLAGGFDQAAVAALRATACTDTAVDLRRVVGPDGDVAAIAAGDCIGIDARVGADVHGRSVLLGAGAV